MRLIWLLLIAIPVSAETLHGRIVGIVDGDTVDLLVERTQHRIRLDQIDTPERGQPWGNRARQALADKVFQEDVRVEVSDTDRYNRLIGAIWLGDRDINREMVREGHAWAYHHHRSAVGPIDIWCPLAEILGCDLDQLRRK